MSFPTRDTCASPRCYSQSLISLDFDAETWALFTVFLMAIIPGLAVAYHTRKVYRPLQSQDFVVGDCMKKPIPYDKDERDRQLTEKERERMMKWQTKNEFCFIS
ncbi:hypothetical protein L596_000386 [Steinernema carpocapsae]|uniref:Uncharacterized protein n=1 Tax=Steinernema carpocapsae TaxID=34508 RepID=A0A4U8UIN0_STECR|nr:hypothetical protein L596_000386 [Steinernema carpocapsae]